jgi:RNA-directed DNA polymerase
MHQRGTTWVFEADITACFDEIDHTALMGRVRRRIGDKRVLLREGVLESGCPHRGRREQGHDHRHPARRDPVTALANIALSVLDEHFATQVGRARTGNGHAPKRRRAGEPS